MRAICFKKSVPRVLATLALKKIWRGAVLSPVSPVRVVTLADDTPLPGPKGIRVKNSMCGICGSDMSLLNVNVDPQVHPAAIPTSDTIYLGHEVVGTVTEVGPEVKAVSVGDRVLMDTRFLGPTCKSQDLEDLCEYCQRGDFCLCDNRALGKGVLGVGGGWGDGYTAHESEVWKAPESLSDDQVVLLEPLACGVRAALRRRPEPGDRVLVIGCGIIGLGVVQALRALYPEVKVFALARYKHQQDLAEKYGATIVSGDVLEVAKSHADAKIYQGDLGNRSAVGGFDMVYDCVSSEETLNRAMRATKSGGAVVIVGVNLHRMKVDLTPTWHEEIDIIGSLAHGRETWQGREVSTFDLTAELIESAMLDTEGLITHRFAFANYKRALKTAQDKSSGVVKAVFDYSLG